MINYAGKLLNYIYLCKFEENRLPKIDELLEKSELKPHQLQMAIDYCIERNYLKVIKSLDTDKNGMQNMQLWEILANSIDLVTNNNKFKETFGFGLNLGIVSFNWKSEEK
ncbi:MAG: hypothetical protein PHQ98_04420 [Candidatus ainarchaeum sp.]|nr:hypothetical protein [Candidatus ainarchaeum sp.]